MSKIQFLKAIHNIPEQKAKSLAVVYDVKDTIFESNSQLIGILKTIAVGCLRCQRYNF